MFQAGYRSYIEGPSQKLRASFPDGIIPVSLAGLIYFLEKADIFYCLCGSGEVRNIVP